jgi:translation initiation factor 4A
LIGGIIKDDIKELSNGVNIVIGTPGRVLDLINKKILSLSELTFFVIDDIKKIIERDFIEIISNILKSTNDKCQKAILANINDDGNDIFILNNDLKNKLKIKDDIVLINNINDYRTKLKNYRFFKISLKEEWKFNVLLNLYKLMEISQSIIYCNKQQSLNELNKNLINQKFICNSLDDDNIKTITNFKKGQIRILTTTSELPIKEVNIYSNALIINYELPNDIDSFVKRVGRNEFFGREGTIINFITEDDKNFNDSLEKILENKIQELPIELSNIQA